MSTWSPQDDQTALTLAAIRWYAVSIEKLATDIYITNKALYPEARAVLDQAFRDLGQIRKSLQSAQMTEQGCPPGYEDCGGVCLPSCDPMTY